jgi:amino acid permease
MDPEFTKILIRVAMVGGSIGIIGAGILFFAVRAYRKGEFRASVLVAALLAFVFVCCLVLLRFSFKR